MLHTKEWSEIMQEVDRLYWINQTSEGRINCITDYIVRLQSAETSRACPNCGATETVNHCAECKARIISPK